MPYPYTPADIARFESYIGRASGCWNWTGALNEKGYGILKYGGRQGVRLLAHRTSYELAVGPIPEGLLIDHRCRNRACVNPEHLRPVNRKQNKENVGGAQSNSKSGVLGVTWKQRNRKWCASLQHNNKAIHIGYFLTIEEAEAAVVAKRNELFTHNELDRIAA